MDTLFFIVAKLVGGLLRPGSWVVLALAALLLALARGRVRAAAAVGTVTLVGLVALAVVPLGGLLLAPLEQRYPAQPALAGIDGIIVPGGAEDARAAARWGQVALNDGAERFTAALALARRFPNATLLFTGGSGALRGLGTPDAPNAGLAARFFAQQGIAPERLLLEGRSRNTAENAILSHALAAPQPGQRWVLVTSAFHMPRAMRSFRRAGWPGLVAWPVDHRSGRFADGIGWNLAGNMQQLDTALRERVGLLVYGLTGR